MSIGLERNSLLVERVRNLWSLSIPHGKQTPGSKLLRMSVHSCVGSQSGDRKGYELLLNRQCDPRQERFGSLLETTQTLILDRVILEWRRRRCTESDFGAGWGSNPNR